MAYNSEPLIIEQLNINSVGNKKSELSIHLNEVECPDYILCLNDTRLPKSKNLKIKGFRTLRKDHPSGRALPGGVCLLVKNNLIVTEVILSGLDEMIAIDVKRGENFLRVATIYLHPGETLTQRHFDQLLHNGQLPQGCTGIVIMGDLNAHVGIDLRGKTDRAGVIVKNLTNINDFDIMNDSSPTYYFNSRSISSCIDLCLTRIHGSHQKLAWSAGEPCGSDHVITRLKIEDGFRSRRKTLQVVDWEGVRSSLKEYSPDISNISKESIELSIDNMNATLLNALKENSKPITIFTRNNISLSKETSSLIHLRRRLNKIRRKWEEEDKETDLIRHISNRLNREIKRNIKRDTEAITAAKN